MKYIITSLILLFLTACKTETTETIKTVSIKDDVTFLASDALEGRQTGSDGEQKAAKYIAERFKNIGVQEKGTNGYFQTFTFRPKTDPHQEVNYTVKDGDSTITGTNVIGFIDNKEENTIIIGAHYDHLGLGAEGSLHRGEKAIHNGADDNASGIAVLLNLAERLKSKNTNNNYLFMAFSGEEMGLLGSNYFVKNPTIDTKKVDYMVNMDMVGRLKADSTLAVYGVGTSPILKQTITSNNSKFKIVAKESGVGPSDHTSFYHADIPVLHFFTGQHEDYHKPTDDTEKLNYEGMKTISNYIFKIITDLDNNGKLPFRATKNESDSVPKFEVGLGVTPDYLYDGKGMRIDGTREDTPATNAGIQKGDVVMKIGANEISNMMSYMKALSTFKKGESTNITVKRGEELIDVEVTF
ncbi:MAG: M28 family peptidase [Lacinutrix sp.]|uniref:M20/M25/M40 family metallo-hydrolase n=1 Tax=Lacinutrix sp. TaxID=1937692 RepID=UPI0030B216E0